MGLSVEVSFANGVKQTYTFKTSPVRVGRSVLNNLVLAEAWVSQHHGLIHFNDDRVEYLDLGSTNGTELWTSLGGRRLPSTQPFVLFRDLGQAELRVGELSLVVKRVADEAGAAQEKAVTGRPSATILGTRLTIGDLRPWRQSMLPVEASLATPALAPPAPSGPIYPAGATLFGQASDARVRQAAAAPRPGESGAGRPGGPPAYVAGLTVVAPAAPLSGDRARPGGEAGNPKREGTAPQSSLIPPAPAPPLVDAMMGTLEAFAQGLTELKQGLRGLGQELGVRAVGNHSALHRAQSADDMLTYLLDPHADTRERLEELVDLFADLMIHEVAILNGVKEGVRRLLRELDPQDGFRKSARGGHRSRLDLLGGERKRYQEHFKAIAEDGGQRIVFGEEFARAYADAMGMDGQVGKPPRR